MIYPAPSWTVSCAACVWESRHWSEDQARTMAKVHGMYGRCKDPTEINVLHVPNAKWSGE